MVKRPAEERKKLPPELEAFARSGEEKLRIRRPRVDQGKLKDPREGFTIPGVANRDARSVYDARVEGMRALWNGGNAEPAALEQLGEDLLDARRLRLWRARRVTGFDVFAEDVVSLPSERARELSEAAAQRLGLSAEALDDRTVALWLRTEAGLYEGDPQARVRLRGEGAARRFEFSLTLTSASVALAGAGARHAPLAREQLERALERDAAQAFAQSEEQPASEERALPDAFAHSAADSGATEARPAETPPSASMGGARLLTRRRANDEPQEERARLRPFAQKGDRPPRFEGARERKFDGDRPRKFGAQKFEGDRARKFEGRRDGKADTRFGGTRDRHAGGKKRFQGAQGKAGGFAQKRGGFGPKRTLDKPQGKRAKAREDNDE